MQRTIPEERKKEEERSQKEACTEQQVRQLQENRVKLSPPKRPKRTQARPRAQDNNPRQAQRKKLALDAPSGLRAIDPLSGKILWKVEGKRTLSTSKRLLIQENLLLFGGMSLNAVSLKEKRLLWTLPGILRFWLQGQTLFLLTKKTLARLRLP